MNHVTPALFARLSDTLRKVHSSLATRACLKQPHTAKANGVSETSFFIIRYGDVEYSPSNAFAKKI